jgi:DNA-binding response OmpR family regulator
VDDDDEIRSMLSKFLPARGYKAVVAHNGREALERISDDPQIEIVLMDVSMPEMNGVEALSLIAARDQHPDVIMMSAMGDQDIARQALAMGAFDYIVKPFGLSMIEERISACLSLSRNGREGLSKRSASGGSSA